MMGRVLAVLLLFAGGASAQDVLVLGEIHDNPVHHDRQAEEVARFAPEAIVFEMLTEDQAARVTPALRQDSAALANALDWDESGWPDFAMYHPIITAAPGAELFGAGLPRAAARAAMEDGAAAAFGAEAEEYGLASPLPDAQQAEREALQGAAHCDALPAEMLPAMVAVQRLRDAMLARAVVRAKARTGGPVAVITGNGHARRDWGMPAVLARVAPGLDVRVIGQTEDGKPLPGTFDTVLSAPPVTREDSCDAFR
ncbi:MAG: ChaN family lipoprotein [Roseovarius sp.]|nr:ChaN family lipoprotein [Roseovarius sp.]